jgi:hypothetical protein
MDKFQRALSRKMTADRLSVPGTNVNEVHAPSRQHSGSDLVNKWKPYHFKMENDPRSKR